MKPAPFSATQQGLFYGLIAYGWWGLVPLFFKELDKNGVPPLEILAHRIVWSVLFLVLLLALLHRWADLGRCLRSPRLLRTLVLTTLLIAINWFAYIFSVSTHQIVQASLGYFITPLVSVLLAVLFLGERLRRLQWLAVGLATTGVVVLTVAGGRCPGLPCRWPFPSASMGCCGKGCR